MPALFVGITVLLTVAGQLLVKKGMLTLGPSPQDGSLLPRYVFRTLTSWPVILGLLCAIVAAVSWTLAVSRATLSATYPFMALAIVLVLALSGALFSESVPIGRWLGVAIVCIGLVVSAFAR